MSVGAGYWDYCTNSFWFLPRTCNSSCLFRRMSDELGLMAQGPLSRYTSSGAEGAGSNGGRKRGGADTEALAAAHVNAVTGACLAIGIRYAGSANAAAQALLQEQCLAMLRAKEAAPDPSFGARVSVTLNPKPQTLVHKP